MSKVEKLQDDNVELGIETPEEVNETTAPKRRTRKPRVESGPVPEAAPTSEAEKPQRRKSRKPNANAVAQIVGVHKMISLVPGMEAFAIEETEAQILAEGMQGIADEYGVALSGKTGATLNLLIALGMVYGPRFYLLYQQNQLAKDAAKRLKGIPAENIPEVNTVQ